MNSCVSLDAELEDYLAGRLALSDAELLEAHAATCERCAAILETRGRLDVSLPLEIVPDPRSREVIVSRIAAKRHAHRRVHWWIPTAIAASLLLALSLGRPGIKSGQGGALRTSPAALAAERADGPFQQLDAARAEVRDALVKAPGDAGLQRALDRLDAQRRSLENLIREFET